MKATELMIGDWVCCTFWSEPKNYQVDELKHCADNELKVVVRDIGFLIFPEKYIEPIHLTPEILEKNGLEWRGNCGMFKEDTDYYLELLKEDDIIWWSVNWAEYTLIPIHYVHQLQHALRLCGIDKEIIL